MRPPSELGGLGGERVGGRGGAVEVERRRSPPARRRRGSPRPRRAPRSALRPLTTTCAPSRPNATRDRAADVAGGARDERGLVLQSHVLDCTVQSCVDEERTGDAGADRRARRPTWCSPAASAARSLDDICAGTRTSRSQLFHYFPAGKSRAGAGARRVPGASGCWTRSARGWTRSTPGSPGRAGATRCSPTTAPSRTGAARSARSPPSSPAARRRGAQSPRTWSAGAPTCGRASSGCAPPAPCARTRPGAPRSRVFASLHGGLLLTQTMQSLAPLGGGPRRALATCANLKGQAPLGFWAAWQDRRATTRARGRGRVRVGVGAADRRDGGAGAGDRVLAHRCGGAGARCPRWWCGASTSTARGAARAAGGVRARGALRDVHPEPELHERRSSAALVCSQAVWAGLFGRMLGERMPRRAWIGTAVCFARRPARHRRRRVARRPRARRRRARAARRDVRRRLHRHRRVRPARAQHARLHERLLRRLRAAPAGGLSGRRPARSAATPPPTGCGSRR